MDMTDRWADKQKKNIENHGGGGGDLPPLPLPPWRRAWINLSIEI